MRSHTGSNRAFLTTCALLPLLPGLTLTAADISGDGPVFITVRNVGVVTATAPVLAVWSGGLTGTLFYGRSFAPGGVLGDIGPGKRATVPLALPAGRFGLWVKANPGNRIAEGNEGNNLAVRAVEVPHRIYLPLVVRDW